MSDTPPKEISPEQAKAALRQVDLALRAVFFVVAVGLALCLALLTPLGDLVQEQITGYKLRKLVVVILLVPAGLATLVPYFIVKRSALQRLRAAMAKKGITLD